MSGAAETLAALRAAVARIEGCEALARADAARVAFGASAVDAALGGGLKRGAWHAVSAASPAAAGAATGFAGALAGLAAGAKGAVLWIRQDMAARESGELWGPGLVEVGLDPRRLVLLRAPDMNAALKAAEAGFGSRALAVIVLEPFGTPAGFGRVAGRRLALAAGRSGALGLFLRLSPAPGLPAGLSAAETRWRVAPLSSAWGAAPASPSGACEALEAGASQKKDDPQEEEVWGRPVARVELVRNRLGAIGRWPLAWGYDDGLFRPAVRARFAALDLLPRLAAGTAPDPRARLAGPVDRPDQAVRTGAGRRRSAG